MFPICKNTCLVYVVLSVAFGDKTNTKMNVPQDGVVPYVVLKNTSRHIHLYILTLFFTFEHDISGGMLILL